jgi:hypothetical protein
MSRRHACPRSGTLERRNDARDGLEVPPLPGVRVIGVPSGSVSAGGEGVATAESRVTGWRCPHCGAEGTYRAAAGAAWCTACHADVEVAR